jgi:hypothetical protein
VAAADEVCARHEIHVGKINKKGSSCAHVRFIERKSVDEHEVLG